MDDHQGCCDRQDEGVKQKCPTDQCNGRTEIQRVADVGVRTGRNEDGLCGRSIDFSAEGAAQGEVVNGEAENCHADHDKKGADKPCEPGGCWEGKGKPEEAYDGDGKRAIHEHYCRENDPDWWSVPGHKTLLIAPNDPKLSHGHRRLAHDCNLDSQIS